MRVSSSIVEGGMVERRELHVTTTPQSTSLKREFGALVFRIVEKTAERPTDRNGNPIVGGVNTFPEPVHVVLFVAPETIAMLSQRASTGNLVISICPGVSFADWDQSDAIPVYEAAFEGR